MKTTLLIASLAAALLWAAPARAEYICEVFVFPPSAYPSMGTAGGIAVAYDNGPDCTGGFIKYSYYCSTGATNTQCGTAANCSGTDWLFGSSLLYQLMSMAQQAMLHNQVVFPNACSPSGKAGTMDFFAN